MVLPTALTDFVNGLITVAIASDTAAKAAQESDYEDDKEDEPERHSAVPFRTPVPDRSTL